MNTNRMTMKEARENSGMTLSAACAAMQISRSKLLSWESGKSLPAADEAIRMAMAYGFNLNDIDFSRTDSKRITFDTSALKTRIMSQGTITAFAADIGMSPRALGRRLAGKTEFTYDEIMKIKTVLNLDNAHINQYFFTPKEIAEKVYTMTCAEFLLFEKITNLCIGRPDRQRYALNYTGEMSDLPDALAQI